MEKWWHVLLLPRGLCVVAGGSSSFSENTGFPRLKSEKVTKNVLYQRPGQREGAANEAEQDAEDGDEDHDTAFSDAEEDQDDELPEELVVEEVATRDGGPSTTKSVCRRPQLDSHGSFVSCPCAGFFGRGSPTAH